MSVNHADVSGTKNPNFGKHLSEFAKKRISAANKARYADKTKHPMYGKPRSEETRIKLSVDRRGELSPWFGKKHSEETKHKQRLSTLAYLEHTKGSVCPRVGCHETHLLDTQEILDGISILRQYYLQMLGYYVDGYCPSTNTVYEVYERRHLRPKVVARDTIRQQEIETHLKCNFIIIWDRLS